jgi:TolA-binding protein
MNERLERARWLGRQLDAAWRREDVEAQLAQLHARLRRRTPWRMVAAPLAVAVAAAVAVAIANLAGVWSPAAPREAPRPASVVPDRAVERPPHERPRHEVETAPIPASATPEPREPAPEARSSPVAAPQDSAPVARDEPVAPPVPSSTWREHADRGDYPAAWAAFEHAATPLDSMEDRLLAGDVARLSGHPAVAVTQLSRAVALYPADPRAPLAAFTLGRVHLEDLGAPREAAQAFARARELSPGGPLAEDALAREVEAWSRAGETETARTRARTYLQRYPRGHRVHAVRRFGGVEGP